MKAIAIRQPHITKLAAGEVTIEVKTWKTDYRGELLMVSALTPRIEPAGYAMAVGRLVDCRGMTRADEKSAGKRRYQQAQAWIFEDVHPIKMFPVKPGLALFDVSVPAFGIRRGQVSRALSTEETISASIPKTSKVLDVLVLDGDAPVARGMQRWVLNQHRTRVVESLEQARAAIRHRTPDVVVCDYQVGSQTTAPLLEFLATRYPQVRRVLYASSRSRVWQRFIDASLVHGAVVKPASREELIGVIANPGGGQTSPGGS